MSKPAAVPTVVVAGDTNVGKTCMIIRYVRDMFSEAYRPTLQDHWQSDVPLSDGETLPIQITDTAGQEDFAPLRDLSLSQADLLLIVYSVTDFKSLRCADKLLDCIGGRKFVLAGNKCDLESDRQVSKTEAQAVADRHKGTLIECSAFTRQGLADVFRELGRIWTAVTGTNQPAQKFKNGCCAVQ
jgi:small GTP-binding protein